MAGAAPRLALREVWGWRCWRGPGVVAWFKGHLRLSGGRRLAGQEAARHLSGLLMQPDAARLLRGLDGHFAVALERRGEVIAATDRIRSVPLFHVEHEGAVVVGSDAAALLALLDDRGHNPDAALEAAMGGYCLGSDTLYRGLRQMEAGSLLRAGPGGLALERYHAYAPWSAAEEAPRDLLRRDLEATLRAMFEALAADADGRTIMVPLSGGLDSRLIASGLKAVGYPHVVCFAYGRPGNFDAVKSREVAEKLGYPWHFVPYSPALVRGFRDSAAMAGYLRMADSHAALPFVQDLLALTTLRERRLVPEGAIFVNGQTGDFISGNHIPPALHAPRPDLTAEERLTRILDGLIAKHFSLWRDLKTPANLARLARRLRARIADLGPADWPASADHGIYEMVEYQERQAKFVIGGQRVYEYLGFDWRLPLWDAAFVDFWERAPLAAKVRQSLYKETLADLDWGGVWRPLEARRWVVPRWAAPLRAAASLPVRAVAGRSGWAAFDRRVFLHLTDPLCVMHVVPWSRALLDRRGFRHGVSFRAEAWLAGHGIGPDSVISRADDNHQEFHLRASMGSGQVAPAAIGAARAKVGVAVDGWDGARRDRPVGEAAPAAIPRLGPEGAWRRQRTGAVTLHWRGDLVDSNGLTSALPLLGDAADLAGIARLLAAQPGHYALVAEGPGWTLAATDPARSICLGYGRDEHGHWRLDDQPGRLRRFLGLSAIDPDAALAIANAGYTLGDRALYRGLRLLGPGEAVLFRAGDEPRTIVHHGWAPWRETRPATSARLAETILAAVDRTIRAADGRPIVVPLSAGRDSRLVASALRHLGARDVRLFTYSRRHGFEAATAAAVAARLGYPWTLVTQDRDSVARFHGGAALSAYLVFADSGQATPYVQDLDVVSRLLQEGWLPDDAVIVNGNTGDFLSGGHVPLDLRTPVRGESAETRWARIAQALVDKHLGLWEALRTPERLKRLTEMARAELAALGADLGDFDRDHGLFEVLEFRNRQVKYVIAGQRAYDFLGLDWRLPLWDRDLMDLFAGLPLADKVEQRLYAATLAAENWGGVWDGIPINDRRVRPRWLASLRFVAKALHLPLGQRRWHRFQRRAFQYWMEPTGNVLSRDYREVLADPRGARNHVAWLTERYLAGNGLAFDGSPLTP